MRVHTLAECLFIYFSPSISVFYVYIVNTRRCIICAK